MMIFITVVLIALVLAVLYVAVQRYQERRMKRQLEEVMNVFEKMGGDFK